jgi:hypothetical protein
VYYETSAFREKLEGTRDDRVHGIVVLLPSESKRLIAKGVLAVPEVRRVLRDGRFVISRGTSTAYIAEELLGVPLVKANCTAGIVTDSRLSVTVPEDGLGPWVFRGGVRSEEPAEEALKQFAARDVSVKGANAIDPEGNVGVLAANDVGGTIGAVWPVVTARGSHLIVPAGLEKMVPSVLAASRTSGNRLCKYVMGTRVSLIPVVNAQVVTEIQALEILTGVRAVHVASGGVGGSEGAVVLGLEGSDETVRRAFELVQSVKGEPPVGMPRLQPPVQTVFDLP